MKVLCSGFEAELPFIGIKNSFLFAGLSTIVDLILGLLIAYVVVETGAIPGTSR